MRTLRWMSSDRVPVVLALIAIAGVMTTFSRLRLEAIPFGLGECLLVVVLGLGGAYVWHFFRTPQDLTEPAIFWSGFFAFVLLGSACGVATGVLEFGQLVRDLVAHALAAATFLIVTALWFRFPTTFPPTVGAFFAMSVANCVVLFALSFAPPFSPIFETLWYASWRFAGLSWNPNQLALTLLAIPFLGLYLVDSSKRRHLLWVLPVVFVVMKMAVKTRTDALGLAWLVGAAAFLAPVTVRGWRWLTQRFGALPYVAFAATVAIGVCLTWGALAQWPLVHEAWQTQMEADNNQGHHRLVLFVNAIEAAATSPFTGFGFGHFSGVTGPFQSSEAHNIFFDILTKGGVPALVFFCAWSALLGWRLYLCAKPTLFGLWAATLTFSCFHYTLRHPLFWIIQAILYFAPYYEAGLRRDGGERNA